MLVTEIHKPKEKNLGCHILNKKKKNRVKNYQKDKFKKQTNEMNNMKLEIAKDI